MSPAMSDAYKHAYKKAIRPIGRWQWTRHPEPLFCREFYLDENPDVRRWGGDPYIHFIRYGRFEKRMPNPFLDLDFYERHMVPLAPGYRFETAFDHFKNIGSMADLWPCGTFDPVYYRERYEALSNSVIVNSLEHFLTVGISLGYFCTHPCYGNMEGML
jgi:hypothetical protein